MSAKRARSIAGELSKAKIGDKRLPVRLGKITEALMARPGASLPQAMRTEAGLEAAYRFLNNDAVTPAAILKPHIEATADRVIAAGGAYCISDTTELRFGGTSRKELGPLQCHGNGFHLHLGLAVAADGSRLPLGILGWEVIVRSAKPKRRGLTKKSRKAADSESRKWARVAEAADNALGGRAPLIHLMDREADIYALLADLVRRGTRFIVRIAQDRRLVDEEGTLKLFEALETSVEVATRDVPLSRRRLADKPHPRRAQRGARLTFASKTLELRRPATAGTKVAESLRLNFVHVFEKDPPDGETPVDWKLVTSEPIETAVEVEAVVDGYRTRWVIEEYNKALKSGCRIERSQIESLGALLNLLAIILPVAAQLLALRSLAAVNGSAISTGVLTHAQLGALRLMSPIPVPRWPSARQALAAVAALGGHIKNNGPPGWQVLHRGFQDLLRYAEIWKVLKQRSIRDQS